MRTSFVLTFTAATSVLGECFNGGDNWASQKALALTKAQDVCNLNGKKADFILEKISDGRRGISASECYDGFQKEINGCDNGGSTSYTKWKYTADPNSGGCADS
ncbi:hypothetical protein BJ170DRAFT_698499 [Xylariales sp. AK1849]|nr:hypothetical protein BJ170DRAFT_698499 [Xylariales sp. AK1849]